MACVVTAVVHAQVHIVRELPVWPTDVNRSGQVVGNAGRRTSLWQQGAVTDLGLENVGGFNEGAKSLNDFGQIVGDVSLVELSPLTIRHYGFLWQSGVEIDLGTTGFARFSVAFAINNAGQIAGFEFGGFAVSATPFCSAADELFYVVTRAFRWEDGVLTALTPPSPTLSTQARGINETGQIVGFSRESSRRPVQQAFIWDNGTMNDLPGEGGEAYAINDSGQVVGRAGPFAQSQAVRWIDGQFIALGALGGPKSGAWDINNRGQIVGWAETDVIGANACPVGHAFLYENGQMFDLNDRLPPDSGWELLEARAINDRGQIVGRGLLNGERRGFLLTPITGDTDGDGDVDLADLLTFNACFSGPGVARPAEPACVEVDLDADGDVDLADLVALQANFTGSH